MSRTKKFKMTDLGPIPEDWEIKSVEQFADVTTGNRNTQDAVPNGAYPFYVRSPIVERLDEYTFDTEGVVTVGDGVGTGKVFHYVHGKFALHQRAYLIYQFKEFEPKFFYWVFSRYFFDRVMQMTAKSSVDSVRREMITGMTIACPTLPEQRCIAEALSDADELIAALTELLEKKRNLKQGAMQQLLTGKRRLPGFKGKWGEKPLGDLLDYEQPQPYIVSNAEYDEDGIPVLTAGKSFVLGYTHDKTGVYSNLPVILFDDFLTISRFIAFPFKVKSSAVKMLHLKDERNSLAFIQMAMERLGYVPGDHQRHWISIFSKFQIPLPEPDEQHAITLMLTDMDDEIAGIEAELEKAKNMKTGMMQQLLTGKVRLEES